MFKQYSFSFPVVLVRALFAMLLIALHLPTAAQAPAWQSAWAVAAATAASSNNFSEVTATAVDVAGNVYLTGNFKNIVLLGGITLRSLGGYDVFIAKFDPTNNQFMWAQRAGGVGDDIATSLAVSGASVYVAGYFDGPTAGFGTVTLTNMGTSDMFVAKLTDAGSTNRFTWAQRAGGTGYDYAYALAVSGTSVYVAGSFVSPTAGFGPTTLTNISSTSTADMFVAKLTDAGSTSSFIWAQRAGGTSNETAYALAVSSTSVYVAGSFASPNVSFGAASLTNTGTPDVFVAKLTDAGSTSIFAWAQQAGGIGDDRATALAVGGGSVYVTGYFNSSTAGFGTVALSNAGGSDVFVAKLTDTGSTGNFVWAQQAGSTSYDVPYTLVLSNANVYVAGYFSSPTVSFGNTVLTNASQNAPDVFVAKLNDAGSTSSFTWAQQAGGTGIDGAYALAVSGTSVYVAGYFSNPTANFGTTVLTNPDPNVRRGFLASLTDPTITANATGRTLAPAQLFPNPAHGTATLRLPVGTAPAPLMLTDALGRAMRHYPAPASNEAVLDLSGLPAGLYLLRGVGPAQRLVVE